MATIHLSGFETGHNSALEILTGGCTVSTGGKRTGDYSLYVGGAVGAYARSRAFDAAAAEIYMRYCIYSLNDYMDIFKLLSSAGGSQLAFERIDTTGEIRVRRGQFENGTVIAIGGYLSLNAWTCLEIRAKIDGTNGILQVKQNGMLIIDFAGNTQAVGPADVQRIQFGGRDVQYYSTHYHYADDIIVNDTTGTRNNSWPGRGGIYPMVPNGAGTYTQLTPSAGANYECVDERPANDDTDYVHSDVLDEKDTYALSNLPVAEGDIAAIHWWVRARLESTGPANVARLLRTGVSDYQGSDLGLDISYVTLDEIIELNPDTSLPWTVAELNALEAGVVVR